MYTEPGILNRFDQTAAPRTSSWLHQPQNIKYPKYGWGTDNVKLVRSEARNHYIGIPKPH